jgi:signal transduction histidine kinase
MAGLLGILALAGLARATPASSALILERSFWEDKSATAQLLQAKSQAFAPFEGHFSRGYSASAHWVRLRLDASATPIGLRVTPPWVDELTLYDELDPGVPQRGGDRHPEGITVSPVLGYSFVLPASAFPRNIWVRLHTTSAQQLHFQAMPADELHAAETRAIVWVSLYSAVLLLILLALLGAWFVQRDTVLGIYLLRHSVYLIYGVSYLGLPFFLLDGLVPGGSFHAALSLSITVLLPLGLWFDITLLKTYQPRSLLLRAAQGLCVLSLGLPILWLLGFERHAVHATVMGLMPAALLVFAMAISTRPPTLVEQLMPKRAMLFYYALILSSLFIGLLGKLGLSQPDTWSQYLLILHGLASGLVMTMILIVRGQRQYRHNQQVSWQLQKSQQEAELERRRHQEQSQFLHMLMHELKTPLSIVSLALGTQSNRQENLQHAGRAVRDMKAIIDRCVQADQLGQLSLQPKADEFDLRGVLDDFVVKIPGLLSRLRTTIPDRLPLLRSDRQLLEIVLINLLDNGSRYSDPVTPVLLDARLSRRGGRAGLEVCISNTPGFAGWPDSERVFGKYYRSSSAQSQSGSGLGLFLSRELVQTLGGSLDYAPSERLVRFVLWIPLTPI